MKETTGNAGDKVGNNDKTPRLIYWDNLEDLMATSGNTSVNGNSPTSEGALKRTN
jgi:hypothetical protein